MSVTRIIIFTLVLTILIILAYETIVVILAYPRIFVAVVWVIIVGIMVSPVAWKIAGMEIK